MTAAPVAAPAAPGRAQGVVRRIIVFVILFTLVVVAAIGVTGLLERIIGAGSVIVAGESGLALSLAFALIAGPLAGLVWWWERRKLAEPGERASLVWALYLTAMSLTALITATVALGSAAAAGIDGVWRAGDAAAAVVWSAVWAWHRHMRRSTATGPTRLVHVPDALAAVYGLVVAVVGAIGAVATLISEALAGFVPVLATSSWWLVSVLQSLVWAAIGALVWWWHWERERAKAPSGTFATVVLVIVVGASAATTLVAAGAVLFVALRLVLDTDPVAEVVSALETAIPAALIGGIVWAYHARVLSVRSAEARRAGRLVLSAIALIGWASGFGVVVNALLATFGGTLVDDDPRTLLLGGISALVVGVPVWWLAWRPERPATAEEAAEPARRVYLVAVFGASAIVAIVTLLTIGYRVFAYALDPGALGGLVELIRAPLGLLSATAVVFAYHFAIWRRDVAASRSVVRRPRVGRVILVAGGDHDAVVERLRAETGAPVTVWRAADASARIAEGDLPAVIAALEGLAAPRVLVVADSAGGARVVPLAD